MDRHDIDAEQLNGDVLDAFLADRVDRYGHQVPQQLAQLVRLAAHRSWPHARGVAQQESSTSAPVRPSSPSSSSAETRSARNGGPAARTRGPCQARAHRLRHALASQHAAAIDVQTGELSRWRFGSGVQAPVAWLGSLPGPVRACYEAGPTGFWLYRAAVAAGIGIEVVAPGKTPRGRSDRFKTDRKDAELLARLLLAGSLFAVTVPPVEVEVARELTRCHEACRRDVMNARHRVSKMLLRHGRVYPKPSTWSQEHRRWLSQQQFDQPASELTYANLLASVDGLTARTLALAERLSRLANEGEWWPTVARLRCFRGVDTLTHPSGAKLI